MSVSKWVVPEFAAELQLLLLSFSAMLTAYVVIPLAASLFGSLESSPAGAAACIAGVTAGIGIVLAGTRRVRGSWREALVFLKLDKVSWHSAGRALWLAPALLLAAGALTAGWLAVGTKFGIEFSLPPATRALTEGPLAVRLCRAVTAVLLAPLFEELVFRRAVYGTLTKLCPAAWAAAIGSLAFALMHLSLLQLPGIWWLGWNWQRTAEKDGSIWSSAMVHAVNNLIAVGVIFALGQSEFSGTTWT